MNKYTNFCTPEQTKLALELGAPIEKDIYVPIIRYEGIGYFVDKQKRFAYHIPTTDQMIGWLEEQGLIFCTYKPIDKWVIDISGDDFCLMIEECNSRKEATLAAIDVALGHLKKSRMKY